MNATKSINCSKFGSKVIVYDLVHKYGDWLFKQPLLLALEKDGFKISARRENPHPPIINTTINARRKSKQIAQWAFVFTRIDQGVVNCALMHQYKTVVEIRRINRFAEKLIVWKRGIRIITKNFRHIREQERIRAIASYLNLSYQERSVNIVKPKGSVMVINMNVGSYESDRLNFDFRQVSEVVTTLRKRGYDLRVIRDASHKPSKDIVNFYHQFNNSEIIRTNNFKEACAVIENCDFYFGADSGLAHHAVACGKIAYALYSKRYHGTQPLFQSTFRNHLCYFGDELFADRLLHDIRKLEQTDKNKALIYQINRFLKYGTGINDDPYSNKRKLFTLGIVLASKRGNCGHLAYEFHAQSASIFFADEIMEVDARRLMPLHGKLFMDSRACAIKIQRLITSLQKKNHINLYAKPCSFFYGTAMRDGSSDVDMPTLYAPKLGARKTTVLLQKIKNVLEQSGFSTELPHQIPVLAKNKNGVKLLRPIIKNGKLAHTFCRQMDNENIQKYEARIKLKIIAGEMEQLEQRVFEDSFCRNKNSKRLCKEIRILNLDASHFPEWTFFARKLITATALLGRFGSKGHLILKIRREDCQKTATAIAGLMKHGLVYMIGTRLYPIWNIRRPQHGWFQPITVLAENPRIFQRETVKALGSPMYASAQFRALRSLYFNTLTAAKTISLLKSPNPLIFMEAYRSIACRGIKFGDSTIFSRRELKAYAREKESNCNNPRDRKLSLWSLATGRALPLLPKETNQLTKYNCFVQAFTSGGVLDADATSFFHAPHQTSISAVNFMGPYIERVTRLMHEYFIYTLASGLPKEIIYEKRKELFYAYYVQGRVLLEGPRKQATQAKLFLRKLSISEALLDGRILRKTLRWLRHIKTKQRNTEFLLPWLIKQNKLPKQFSDFDAKENIYIKRLLLLSHKHPQHSMNGADV